MRTLAIRALCLADRLGLTDPDVAWMPMAMAYRAKLILFVLI